MSSERRSTWTLMALAAPCLPLAGLGLPLVVYLPEFYASEIGLDLATVGLAFMAVRLADIGFDPVIGAVMDRTRTRFGRFRLWMVLAVPLLIPAAYMLFKPPAEVGVGHLWLWLVVIYAGYSIGGLAQVSWGAVLSSDYHQRSRIYAFWQTGNVLGQILVMTLPVLLGLAGIAGDAAGVEAMGWFIILALPPTVALAVWKVPEPVLATSAAPTANWRDYVQPLKRPAVQRLLAADLLLGVGPGVIAALFFFYFERVKHFEKVEASSLLLVYFMGALVGAPVWTRLAYAIGKHRSLAVSGVVYAAAIGLGSLTPAGNLPVAAGAMFFIGLPFSAASLLLRAMLADVGDEERLETGKDRTALLYALLAGTMKIGSALAVGVTFVGLQMAGFNAQAAGDAAGLAGLQAIFVATPILVSLAASWLLLGYPLTAERHAEIRARLDERDKPQPDTTLADDEIHATARPAPGPAE